MNTVHSPLAHRHKIDTSGFGQFGPDMNAVSTFMKAVPTFIEFDTMPGGCDAFENGHSTLLEATGSAIVDWKQSN